MNLYVTSSKSGEPGIRFSGEGGDVDGALKAHKDAFVSAQQAHLLGGRGRAVVESYRTRFSFHKVEGVTLFPGEEPYQTYRNMGFSKRR